MPIQFQQLPGIPPSVLSPTDVSTLKVEPDPGKSDLQRAQEQALMAQASAAYASSRRGGAAAIRQNSAERASRRMAEQTMAALPEGATEFDTKALEQYVSNFGPPPRGEDGKIDLEAVRQQTKQLTGAKLMPKDGSADVDATADALRKEWGGIKEVQDYRQAKGALSSLQANIGKDRPTAAADFAAIFQYVKQLDPTSVVRESEFRAAQNTTGLPDRMWQLGRQMLDGTKMTPAQREDFLQSAQDMFDARQANYKPLAEQYAREADLRGVPRDRVMTAADMEPLQEPPAVASNAELAPLGPDDKIGRISGGQLAIKRADGTIETADRETIQRLMGARGLGQVPVEGVPSAPAEPAALNSAVVERAMRFTPNTGRPGMTPQRALDIQRAAAAPAMGTVILQQAPTPQEVQLPANLQAIPIQPVVPQRRFIIGPIQ